MTFSSAVTKAKSAVTKIMVCIYYETYGNLQVEQKDAALESKSLFPLLSVSTTEMLILLLNKL